MSEMEPDQIVRAANEARAIGGSRLGELDLMETLVDYPGAACTIVRCRTMRAQASGTVIVKHWNADQDAMRTEWIALKYLGGLSSTIPLAPALYAAIPQASVLVMEDLDGNGDNLVGNILYSRDARRAEDALVALGAAVGRLHAATVPRVDDFLDVRDRIGSGQTSRHRIHRIPALMRSFEDALGAVGGSLSPGGRREIERAIVEVIDPGPFLVFTHGDVAPGNAFYNGSHVRLFDFETSDVRHALLDGSFARLRYLHSVWARRIPNAVQHRIMDAYRAELVAGCPEAAEDDLFDVALLSCSFAWVAALCEELPAAWREDRKWGRATMRQRIVAALEHFHRLALERGTFEALAADLHTVQVRLEARWPQADCTLPTFPAFHDQVGS